jgi:hypothetical protein
MCSLLRLSIERYRAFSYKIRALTEWGIVPWSSVGTSPDCLHWTGKKPLAMHNVGQGRNAVLPLNSKALQNCAGFYL